MKQIPRKGPEQLGATAQNCVATATLRSGFVHPCTK